MRHIDYYTDIVMGKKGGSGGGITPSGTLPISIQENGTTKHDVTQYAEAEITVQVPEPEGTKEINIVQNGDSTEDVKSYANAHIVVAVPEPTGNIDISQNGQVDVKQYATANVQVPEATGEKVIDIVANGTTTEDVKAFASAKINVNVPQEGIVPSGRLEIAENGVKDVTEYAEVNVQVPVGVFPEGTLEISDNGKQDVTNYAEVNVNVPKGITPEGTKEISIIANGQKTEDVTQYANVHITTDVPLPSEEKSVTYTENKTIDEDVSNIGTLHVTVQVPESGGGGRAYLDELVTRTITDLNDDTLSSIGKYAFARCEKLQSVSLPNVTEVGEGAFRWCNKIASLDIPNLETAGSYAFQADTSAGANPPVLQNVHFPKLETLENYVFGSQTNLEKIKCEMVKSVDQYSLPTASNSKLKVLDILGGLSFNPAIPYLESLTVIFRSEEKVTTLPSTAKLPSSIKVYVHDALVEQYKQATNWSKHADKIFPISEYVEV